jgi:hypothetical protein
MRVKVSAGGTHLLQESSEGCSILRPKSKAGLALAILSTPGFNVSQIKPASVNLGGRLRKLRQDKTIASTKDASGDGIPDLVLTINTYSMAEMLEPGFPTEVAIEARTLAEQRYSRGAKLEVVDFLPKPYLITEPKKIA